MLPFPDNMGVTKDTYMLAWSDAVNTSADIGAAAVISEKSKGKQPMETEYRLELTSPTNWDDYARWCTKYPLELWRDFIGSNDRLVGPGTIAAEGVGRISTLI